MDEDDYDALRERNISERNTVFAEFFNDIKQQTNEFRKPASDQRTTNDSENQPPKKRRRIASEDSEIYRNNNVRLEFRKKYNTRSKGKITSTDESNKDEEEDEVYDDKSFANHLMKKKVYVKITKSKYDPNNIPSVDDITEGMLNKVARNSNKTYCKIRGTSCHQCRQKTLDTKTVCRSGECIGVRGQFCGPCLRGRYGENAVDALKNPNWACPPCRGLCNCSICRSRSGLPPTGILLPLAQGEGFSSVLDYLQAAETDDA